ncbi:hypothetical protein EX895_003259 [Sporisorium graminicola]|uniref:Uncharacterized protein n=1 Tax=Sporisorium graminicola TaxID=280036 RepID=A0A4U7KW59_9BASI|nr:hypothetical protein EX895_003259 [Sporisorium graminicola]TKY87678.1 hypothetical protein EX895_003259 [Sporisorium graminicola]
MSADILSATTSTAATGSPSTTPVARESQPANSITSTTSTSDNPRTNARSHAPKQPDEKITGLTPEQVMQELKKSGYVDQLRRQMIDAFTASSSASSATTRNAPTSSSATAAGAQAATPASQSAPSASLTAPTTEVSATASAAGASPPTPTPAPTSAPSPTTTTTTLTPLDIGTKPAFLSFLSTPLRQQVERQHGNLRNADTRGQQDQLLKLLDSEPVEHPHRDALGDATLYDLLIRHIVTADAPTSSPGTGGMLDKTKGRVGTEAFAKIRETINEMLNPSAKDAEDDEEEDDDEDDDNDEEADQESVAAAVDIAPQTQLSTAETQS